MAAEAQQQPGQAIQSGKDPLADLALEAPTDLAVVVRVVNQEFKMARELLMQGFDRLLQAVLPKIADGTMTVQNVSALMAGLNGLASSSGFVGCVTNQVGDAQKRIREALPDAYLARIIELEVAEQRNGPNSDSRAAAAEQWSFGERFNLKDADTHRQTPYDVGQMIETLFGIATEKLSHPQLSKEYILWLLTAAETAIASEIGVAYTQDHGGPSSHRLQALLETQPADLLKLFTESPHGGDVNARILKLVVGYVPERCVSYLKEYRYSWRSYNMEKWGPCKPECVSTFLKTLGAIALAGRGSPEIIELIRAKAEQFNGGLAYVRQEVVTARGTKWVLDGDGNGFTVPDEEISESTRRLSMKEYRVEF